MIINSPRAVLLIGFVLLSIGLSYLKVFDSYSTEYTDKAIKQAAISYASARGINALVSMLQTSTIEGDAIFISGSVAIGELLDPVNDLIERFSGIMTLVLASLAAQKFLLIFTGQDLFLHLLTVSGLAVVFCLWLNLAVAFNWLLRFFVVTLLLRFALVVVLGLNGLVDEGLIWSETEHYEETAGELRSSLDPDHASGSAENSSLESYAGRAKTWVTNVNLENLEQAVESSISDFMMLIAIYLLKTILFPLLFLYGLYFSVVYFWRLDYRWFTCGDQPSG